MGALDGVRVVDFGQWIAGPLAAMLLGDQGAEVIHVDPPGGPRWKTPANATFNRGKTSVALDLESDIGRAARLAADRRRRRGHRELPARRDGSPRPRGARGDWNATRASSTARCPASPRTTRAPRCRPGKACSAPPPASISRPARLASPSVPISSTFGAIAAAVSIVMALIARERDGLGQRIEVPLFDATFLAIGSTGLLVNGKPEGGRPDDPWAGIFRCADGRWIRLSLATFRFLERFVDAAGKPDWIAKGYVQRERPGPLARGTALRERQQAELADLFRSRPAAEWEELGRRADVPLTLIRTTAEWLATDHARTRGHRRRRHRPGPGRHGPAGTRRAADGHARRGARSGRRCERPHADVGRRRRARDGAAGGGHRAPERRARRHPRGRSHPGARGPDGHAHARRVRRRGREGQQSRARKAPAIAGRCIAITPT